MPVVLRHNKFFDECNWIGAAEMPALDVEVNGDDTCDIPDSLDFEMCLSDWWPWFTVNDHL